MDAGNAEVLRTLSELASKKRQGTKSRDFGERLGSEGYGDLMLAPSSLAGATLGRGDLDAWTQGGRERDKGVSAGVGAYRQAPGALIGVNRVERDRRQRGASVTERDSGGARRRSGS